MSGLSGAAGAGNGGEVEIKVGEVALEVGRVDMK